MTQLKRGKVLGSGDPAVHAVGLWHSGYGSGRMFVFFSNRLGCMGSIVASLVGTLVLLLLLGVINLD